MSAVGTSVGRHGEMVRSHPATKVGNTAKEQDRQNPAMLVPFIGMSYPGSYQRSSSLEGRSLPVRMHPI